MQLTSGMRIGEVLARSEDDYNEKNKTFNVHNTLTQDEKYKVVWSEHTKYTICTDGLTTHRLRHFALTHWRDLGVPLEAIQYLAGHVEGSHITNDIYIDTTIEFVQKVLNRIS